MALWTISSRAAGLSSRMRCVAAASVTTERWASSWGGGQGNAGARRRRAKLPMNLGINFVPQQEAWVVERFGKFHAILEPGLSLLIPFIDEIKYVHTLKEVVIEIPSQAAITQDNVTMQLDGVLYVKVDDPYMASYGVEDPEYAVAQLAQTTMRSELGQLKLDEVFKERQALNELIVAAINKASSPWGLTCLRCEIRDIQLPDQVIVDMQRQVSAERRKRAAILESEGDRDAAVNVAEGKKQAAILQSEGIRLQRINEAQGDAQAMIARAEASAKAVRSVAAALKESGSRDAVSMKIAEDYIQAFGKLAKEGNTLLLPTGVSDPAGMVAQALSIYNTVTTGRGSGNGNAPGRGGGGGDDDDGAVGRIAASREDFHAPINGDADGTPRHQ